MHLLHLTFYNISCGEMSETDYGEAYSLLISDTRAASLRHQYSYLVCSDIGNFTPTRPNRILWRRVPAERSLRFHDTEDNLLAEKCLTA